MYICLPISCISGFCNHSIYMFHRLGGPTNVKHCVIPCGVFHVLPTIISSFVVVRHGVSTIQNSPRLRRGKSYGEWLALMISNDFLAGFILNSGQSGCVFKMLYVEVYHPGSILGR